MAQTEKSGMIGSERDGPVVMFDEICGRELIRLADELPTIWIEMRESGFRINELLIVQIDEVRSRSVGEKPYAQYLQEVLREKLGCYFSLWLPEYRNTGLKMAYRSSYLDWLQSRVDGGEFAFLGEYARNVRANLDPNSILHNSIKFTHPARALELIEQYHVQKALEKIALRDKIKNLSAAPCKPSPTRIARLLEDVFGPIGFSAALRDTKSGRFVFKRTLISGLEICCEYDDHRGMSVGGSWHLVFVLQHQNAPIWDRFQYRSVPLALSPGDFLPGSLRYLMHNGDWDDIVLGCLFTGQLLESITRGLERVLSR